MLYPLSYEGAIGLERTRTASEPCPFVEEGLMWNDIGAAMWFPGL